VSSGSSLDKATTDAKAEHVFIDLLRRYHEQGRDVSHKRGPNYAPAQFANEDAAQQLTGKEIDRRKVLAAAMNRLFTAKKIKTENYGRPSRPYNKIVEQQPEETHHE
jgi:hypothetical protein